MAIDLKRLGFDLKYVVQHPAFIEGCEYVRLQIVDKLEKATTDAERLSLVAELTALRRITSRFTSLANREEDLL